MVNFEKQSPYRYEDLVEILRILRARRCGYEQQGRNGQHNSSHFHIIQRNGP